MTEEDKSQRTDGYSCARSGHFCRLELDAHGQPTGNQICVACGEVSVLPPPPEPLDLPLMHLGRIFCPPWSNDDTGPRIVERMEELRRRYERGDFADGKR